LTKSFGSANLKTSPNRLPADILWLLLRASISSPLGQILKSAATKGIGSPGPLQEFYEALLAKGTKPSLARLTLARKIASITLTVWKKGARFDAQRLKPQAA
jgi:hypothetical protein